MVSLAEEAFRAKNFTLSAEIYERAIQTDGPKLETLLGLADSQARAGDFRKALSTYIRCVRFGKTTPANMKQFAAGLAEFMTQNGAELGLIPSFSQNPFDAFACKKCSGLLIEPVTLPCGHSFCHTCVLKDQSKVCQWCGIVHYFVDIGSLRTNVQLWTIIEKFFHVEIEAARLRAQGNEHFSKQHFEQAISYYTQASMKAPLDHLIISNRSHAYASLDMYTEALADAEYIVQIKPDWAKGYYRKGAALSGLSRHEEASLAYLQCLGLDPLAETARDCLARELHVLVNMCSEADGKTSEMEKTLGLSPLLLLLKLIPESVDESSDARSAPHSRVSSPTRIGSRSLSDENISVLIADGLYNIRANKTMQKRKRARGASPANPDLELSRFQLAFDPGKLTPDDVECPLCMRLLYLPIATPCGHVFCRHCLDRSLDHGVHCPLCKSSLIDHLAERRQATVDALEKLIEICLPAQLCERKSIHEDEMAAITIELKDGQMEVPVFVCTLGFPSMACPLHIFEPRYRLMVRRAMETGARQFAMCAGSGVDGEFSDYGVIMEIRDIQYFPDGRSLVDTIGGRRIRVVSRGVRDGYNTAVVEYVSDQPYHNLQEIVPRCHLTYELCKNWYEKLQTSQKRAIVSNCGEFPREDRLVRYCEDGPKWLWWMVAVLPLNPSAQLSFIKMKSLEDRLSGISNVVKYMCVQMDGKT